MRLSISKFLFCKDKNIFSTLVFLAAIFPTFLHASTQINQHGTPLTVQHLKPAQGLSQNYVFDMVQDKDGFIWVGTDDGLNKYDGKTFKQYRFNSLDAQSLAGNSIRNLLIDSNNNLWIGTDNGVSIYNTELDNFTTFRAEQGNDNTLTDNFVWQIYEDANHNIWVATENALHRFNKEEQSFTHIKVRKISDNTLLNFNAIRTFFQDEKGNYWISNYDGDFYILTPNLTPDTVLTNQIAETLVGQTFKIRQIEYHQRKNHYWIAVDNSIVILDSNYDLYRQYDLNQTNSAVTEIRSFGKLNDALYWVGTDNGLYSINPLEDKAFKHQFSNITPHAFNTNIIKVFIDNEKHIWIGSFNGLMKANYSSLLISHSKNLATPIVENIENITAVEEHILFSKDGELALFNTQSNTHKNIPLAHPVDQIFQTAEDTYIVSMHNELFRFNSKTLIPEEIQPWTTSKRHQLGINLIGLQNKIWYIEDSGNLSSFDLLDFSTQPHLNKKKFLNLSATKDGNLLLISTKKELLYYQVDSNSVKEFTLKNKHNFIFEDIITIKDTTKYLILGSNSQGALVVNKANGHGTWFNETSGLLNNYINAIVLDSNGNAWLSSNKGFSFIDLQTLDVRNFYKDYNLENNENYAHSSTIDTNGNIYFGGNNGFNWFTPDKLLAFTFEISPPVLTSLLIANKEVLVTSTPTKDQFTLSAQLNTLKEITLAHVHSPFSIEFISPNASLPEQLGYQYRLIGVDDNWLTATANNLRATYTNLSAGSYVFEVQAYDRYSPKTYTANSLAIEILPPWWLSSSAILVYSLVVLLALSYLLQQFRHKRIYHLQIKESEERLKLSLWGSGDEMWDWNIKNGKIYRSNIWGTLEFPQDGKRNLGNNDDNETNVNKGDITRITKALQDHFDEKTEHFEATYRVKNKLGNWIWILDRGKIVERDEKNNPVRMTGTLKDISQIKKADERLKLFAKCFENISDAVVIYDRQFFVVDINKAFQRITGKTKKQMIGEPLTFRQYPDSFANTVKQHLLTKGSWHGEIESKRDDGMLYLTDLNIDIIRDENSSISHFVGVFSDITKRKETEAELRKLANSDTLTGLPNRSYFQANQTRLVKNKVSHALLVFDLDNFKKVNDSMGHEVGDVLLCKVAERIRTVGRSQDTVYRLGGDEFSIIVENTNDIHTITTIAKNILRTIAQPLRLKNHEIVLYSSIGIVLYPEDGATPQELLKNADTAMYHAKNAGGNRYKFFNSSMNEQAVKRLQIEGLIRHGLKEDFFSVFYQPKIEIKTGKIAGMEALVRFETPSKGIISPLTFIPVSEETGQIIDIGEVVLRKACYATKVWIDAGLFDGRIAVNLSAVQFTQPNLVGMIAEILAETGLPAKHLELEITEGTVMDSPQQAIDTMLQIRAMGIHLSLDDFGTGYSSLAYLKKFPLNTLKIDKAFVDDIEQSEQGRNMVATIVTIAHNLSLQVVAEGVETNQQLSFLSGLRCEQLQGYLYSKPLATEDFRRYLVSHQITDKSTSFNRS
ncbi:EAL domain-containing protein [Thalassotalea hakodatensis]|uniref:EAL domain-containing protein n=1 Tax=Thalassotalea hakodatensis TaxID=3030492 RepID=UPI002573583E|nr:EAL domain-containing protein [Thalassotalea hakodatensis]